MSVLAYPKMFVPQRFRRILKILGPLVLRDFQMRYRGSTLGIVWMLLQPMAMMLTLWMVFAYGLKVQVVDGHSYAVWFFAAMTAWNFFSEAINSGSSAILDYGFLIKKVRFEAYLLPIVKLMSAFMIHGIFLVILFSIAIASQTEIQWSWLSLPFYTIWIFVFTLGLSYITASVNLFFRDCGQIIAILLQFGFWATPIVWDLKLIPQHLHWLIKLNPLSYVTEGYRSSLIYGTNFWDFNPLQAIYAWTLAILTLVLGSVVFKKLRPHFGDVL